MPTRRLLLAVGLLATPARAASGVCGTSALVKRALERAGGLAALARAKSLSWTGTARILAGPKPIEIGVSTTVRPFTSARSDTWLASEGPSKTRSLIIEGDKGWLERGGVRSDMPAAMLAHERQQYALYGLMLLTPLCGPDVETVVLPDLDGGGRVAVSHRRAPRTTLVFDETARLAGAENTVVAPDEGGAPIDQVFAFEGEIESAGVRWPRRLSISQNGKPYFELSLGAFDASA